MTTDTQELVESLTTLNRIADTLNRAVDIESALQSALASLVELMGLETGWIFLRDPAARTQWYGRGYLLAAHHNLPPALALHKASAWKGGCDCQAFCTKGTLTEAYNEVRCSRLAEAKGEDRRGLVVHASTPLRSGDELLGILNVAAAGWDSFTPEALAVLANAGSLMGIAIERARLFDMLKERRIVEQGALLAFSNQLLGRPNLEDLMSYLTREVQQLLHVDASALFLPADEPGWLVCSAAFGWRNDPASSRLHIRDDGENGASRAMQTQEAVVLNDMEGLSSTAGSPTWLRVEGFRSMAVVPLLVEGTSLGSLVVASHTLRAMDNQEMHLLQLMANQAAIAIEGARLRQEEMKRQRLEEELSLGRQIQLNMLPRACPVIPGWEFVAVYQAARQVGGDFYDYFELPGPHQRLGMLIADVADKGVPAALFMALSRTVIRTTALSGRGAAAALTRANQIILNDSQTDLFLSAFYAILEVETGRMLYANAGHNRPLWYHATARRVQELRARGIILGAFDSISLEERRATLAPGDAVVLYTDGVTEALNERDEMFGLPRLVELVRQHAVGTAQDLANAIVDAYNRFTGDTEQSDDVTFCVVKRTRS